MNNLFTYSFIVRGFEAGLIIGMVAPLIGIFLVLRRYSLIADTLSHVSLAGVAIGLLLKINPIITAIGTTLISSFLIEKLRNSRKVFGESALAIFLSGSLALAIVLLSVARGFTVDIFNYLFGSIVTVKSLDILIIGILGLFVASMVLLFYKQLVFMSFDEEAAQVSGIPVKNINTLFILLAALTIALAIPIVGILLVSALMIIPVLSALQYRKGFKQTLILSEIFSLTSVVLGVIISYYANLATGGTIVLIIIGFFLLSLLFTSMSNQSIKSKV